MTVAGKVFIAVSVLILVSVLVFATCEDESSSNDTPTTEQKK